MNAGDPVRHARAEHGDERVTPERRNVPHNIEIEQAVLGACLINNDAALQMLGSLTPDHFHEPVHGRIWGAIRSTIDDGGTATPVTLKAQFENDDALADVGGAEYLVRLAGAAVTILDADYYARTLVDLWQRRELLDTIESLADAVSFANGADDRSASDLMHEVDEQLRTISDKGVRSGGFTPYHEILMGSLRHTEAAMKGEMKPGIMTGLHTLDRVLDGLMPGDFIVLAGRPGMGKSLIAQAILTNCARQGDAAALVSLEMSRTQLGHRALGAGSGVPYNALKSGRVGSDQIGRVVAALGEAQDLPIYIDTSEKLAVAHIRDRARWQMNKQPIKLLVIDYLQLIEPERAYLGNKVAEVEQISGSLKRLARELDIPVVVVSQLSRAVETRDDKRPMMSDLRWTGSIEQDADTIIFAYRRHYYEKFPPHDVEAAAEWTRDRNVTELIVAKNRQGATSTVRIFADMANGRISDLQEEYDDGEALDFA